MFAVGVWWLWWCVWERPTGNHGNAQCRSAICSIGTGSSTDKQTGNGAEGTNISSWGSDIHSMD